MEGSGITQGLFGFGPNNRIVTKDEEPLVDAKFVDHYLRIDKE